MEKCVVLLTGMVFVIDEIGYFSCTDGTWHLVEQVWQVQNAARSCFLQCQLETRMTAFLCLMTKSLPPMIYSQRAVSAVMCRHPSAHTGTGLTVSLNGRYDGVHYINCIHSWKTYQSFATIITVHNGLRVNDENFSGTRNRKPVTVNGLKDWLQAIHIIVQLLHHWKMHVLWLMIEKTLC